MVSEPDGRSVGHPGPARYSGNEMSFRSSKWGPRKGGWPLWGEETSHRRNFLLAGNGALWLVLGRNKVVPRKLYALGYFQGRSIFLGGNQNVQRMQR